MMVAVIARLNDSTGCHGIDDWCSQVEIFVDSSLIEVELNLGEGRFWLLVFGQCLNEELNYD